MYECEIVQSAGLWSTLHARPVYVILSDGQHVLCHRLRDVWKDVQSSKSANASQPGILITLNATLRSMCICISEKDRGTKLGTITV